VSFLKFFPCVPPVVFLAEFYGIVNFSVTEKMHRDFLRAAETVTLVVPDFYNFSFNEPVRSDVGNKTVFRFYRNIVIPDVVFVVKSRDLNNGGFGEIGESVDKSRRSEDKIKSRFKSRKAKNSFGIGFSRCGRNNSFLNNITFKSRSKSIPCFVVFSGYIYVKVFKFLFYGISSPFVYIRNKINGKFRIRNCFFAVPEDYFKA
jgi:hypothetical protein